MKRITLLAVALIFCHVAFAQFPEGFEDPAFPPAGWVVYNGVNGLGTDMNWTGSNFSASGTGAASVDSEFSDGTVSFEDWLVAPQIAITAANSVLTFQQQHFTFDTPFSQYTVRVSTTSQTDIASFTAIDTQFEGQLPDSYLSHSVDLGAYIGQSVYVAFVFTSNNGGVSWYIDNVNLTSPASLPSCTTAVFPATGAVGVAFELQNYNNIDLSWSAPASGIAPESYQIYLGTDPANLKLVAETPDTTITLGQFLYSTQYYWKVLASTPSGTAITCATWSFTTFDETPLIPNYFTSFDDGYSDVQWTFGVGAYPGPPVLGADFGLNNWNYWDYANVPGNALGAYVNLNDSGTNDWLLSPLFDLSGGPFYLNFDIALTQFDETTPAAFSTDQFVALMASTDAGQTWTEITRWDATTPISNSGMSVPQIMLNQSGNTKFAFMASVGNEALDIDFFVNNFRITHHSLAVAQNDRQNLVWYPNPVSNVLMISGSETITAVTVYNVLGQNLLEKRPADTNCSLDLSAFRDGTYMIRVNTGNAFRMIKVIKQ